MNIKRIFVVIIILILIITILYYLNYQQNSINGNSNKVGVVVSVGPEVEFVKSIGGDKVDVTVMVPPGADPHTYEPLPYQLSKLSSAKIYAEVGTPLEFELNYMDKIKNLNSNMIVVNCSNGINLLPNSEENESGNDPHVWTSPKNAKIMVENIYQSLILIDPNNTAYYTANKNSYIKKLDELDQNITESLEGKQNSSIIVYHPAWAYFCKDYGLKQIPIEYGGKEPTAQEIMSVIDYAKKNNVKVIFVEPQYNPKSAEVIASEIHGQVVIIDDLSENYIKNLENAKEAFSKL